LGAIYWRGATRKGALAGVVVGFTVWAATLFIPAIGLVPEPVMQNGLFGIAALRPQALLGMTGLDPLVHSVLWSMTLNTAAFIIVSLVTFPSPMERLQGAGFVHVFERSGAGMGYVDGIAETEDLLVMAQRLLGGQEAQRLFQTAAAQQGKSGHLPDPTPEFVSLLERELAGSVGAATAHAMVRQINGSASVSVQDLLAVADESAQMLEYSNQLEAKSKELEQTAKQLRDANQKLTALSVQKDAFLSQVSHELRTPMTSIRSFSEFLMVVLNEQSASLGELIDRALRSAGAEQMNVLRDPAAEAVILRTDTDRLSQVFINLISNAQKYCDAGAPRLKIKVAQRVEQGEALLDIDFIDNGSGIPDGQQSIIFEKFARLSDTAAAGSAGLGLAICREVMARLGGTITYLRGQQGGAFRVSLPSTHRSAETQSAA
jgi:signal transduction histidine kinase